MSDSTVDRSSKRTAEPMTSVEINRVAYVPRDTVIPDKVMKTLARIYCIVGGELYDPENDSVLMFAKQIWGPLQEVNAVLRFKK